jgi:hypothetical protein
MEKSTQIVIGVPQQAPVFLSSTVALIKNFRQVRCTCLWEYMKKKDFYNILYYYKKKVVWLDLTVQNILYYIFLLW